jgi:uncharacterized repeat protein (TIGR04138 family)
MHQLPRDFTFKCGGGQMQQPASRNGRAGYLPDQRCAAGVRCRFAACSVTLKRMPAPDPSPPPPEPTQSLQEIADSVGTYPVDAFRFVQEGLSFAVGKVHGEMTDPKMNRHVTGQQLCQGLREYALATWGLMARAVLARWGITSTMDFGRIVFALIDASYMQKTETDTIEDFQNVFDFKTAFDAGYRIESKSP